MRKVVAALILLVSAQSASAQTWNGIDLPNLFTYPPKIYGTEVYSMKFPDDPVNWYPETCNGVAHSRPTSIRWVSSMQTSVKGIAFKGLVYPYVLGTTSNQFAVFFHENYCYDGHNEYGYVFWNNTVAPIFYVCSNCNNIGGNQEWYQVNFAGTDERQYKYWEIEVNTDGSFTLIAVDPISWASVTQNVPRPSWLPNLYNDGGYVTVTALKIYDETLSPEPYMHVDEVKVRQ